VLLGPAPGEDGPGLAPALVLLRYRAARIWMAEGGACLSSVTTMDAAASAGICALRRDVTRLRGCSAEGPEEDEGRRAGCGMAEAVLVGLLLLPLALPLASAPPSAPPLPSRPAAAAAVVAILLGARASCLPCDPRSSINLERCLVRVVSSRTLSCARASLSDFSGSSPRSSYASRREIVVGM